MATPTNQPEGPTNTANTARPEGMPEVGSPYAYDTALTNARDNYTRYESWAASSPEVVEAYIARYTERFRQAQRAGRPLNRLGAFATRRSRADRVTRAADEIAFFHIINMGESPSPPKAYKMASTAIALSNEGPAKRTDRHTSFGSSLANIVPGIYGSDELAWLENRMARLQKILPSDVIEQGGMGKAAKTIMGILAIAAFSNPSTPSDIRRRHILSVVRPAYYYGATYPIVDDALQDGSSIDSSAKEKFHRDILRGLRTGADIAGTDLPDHPLTEEMLDIYDGVRKEFPFRDHPDLYAALTTMYTAQDQDTQHTPEHIHSASDIYPVLSIKAAMSRIVANMFARNELSDRQTSRITNSLLRNQLVDDARDWPEDLVAGRHTPFTLAYNDPTIPIGNPLLHTLAFEAYVAHVIYGDDPNIAGILSQFGSAEMGKMLANNKSLAGDVKAHFGDGDILDDLIDAAKGVRHISVYGNRFDQRGAKRANNAFGRRVLQEVDPRTFAFDHINKINDLILQEFDANAPIQEVIRYSLEAGGKRMRPALTLMLADSLGIDKSKLEPLLISVEVAHTASLIFDDLPAQDNATLRRGRPTAHIVFPESDAQLAGISMIAHSLGSLGALKENFPADKVTEVIEYVGTTLGAKNLCLGQHMDMSLGDNANLDEIIEMYNLKTSSLIEGSLMPLMILADRPQQERNLIRTYARHAGIVYQLRDDILDATSTAATTGKDSNLDAGKHNVVTHFGLEAAHQQLQLHLSAALDACTQLPFKTGLLESTVQYFATRKK